MSSTYFNSCKVVTLTFACNYCYGGGHKYFRFPKKQKNGYNGDGETSGIRPGCYSSGTMHQEKFFEKGFWDTPTNNYYSDTQ